jgi:hypothetical protein
MDERDDPLPTGWIDAPVEIERLVGQRDDGTEWSVEFDRALCVEMGGERGYIVGNTHTHRGRFHVCFPDRTEWVTVPVSVYELDAVSAEARYWLRGFLTGYEPDVYEYLGREKSEGYDPTDEEWARYRNFIEQQHLRDGTHNRLNKRPDRALVITDEERAEIHLDPWRPWTYVGERVLVPDGAEWVEADPQPEMDGPWLAGSVCAEREHDSRPLIWLDSGWSVCSDCGAVVDRR